MTALTPILADRDALPARAACPTCKGSGGWHYDYSRAVGGLVNYWTQCPDCDGEGFRDVLPKLEPITTAVRRISAPELLQYVEEQE